MFAAGNMLFNDVAGMVGERPVQPEEKAIASPLVGRDTIADIVEKASPAVVKIDTQVKVAGNQWNPFFDDPFFREFFGRPLVPSQPRVQHGMGSGFLISDDGYILTNEHVIQGADEISVTLIGYEEPFPAKVIGADHDLDLAVIKINPPKKMPYLKLGDSGSTKVGEWVIAIGNPYGLDHTVTAGVVSAKGRPITIDDRYYGNLLQTDASINPGNSGGPLLNLQGEVIGVNTAVNAQAQGIGFAIPTSTIKPVLDELIETGKIAHPWMGVHLQEVSPQLAKYSGLEDTDGALVYAVVPSSPADRAGLKTGDIILKIDERKIKNTADVIYALRKKKVGDTITVHLVRQGDRMTLKLKLAERPERLQ